MSPNIHPVCLSVLGKETFATRSAFYVGAQDSNSGGHAYAASTLPAEHLPSPIHASLLELSFGTHTPTCSTGLDD